MAGKAVTLQDSDAKVVRRAILRSASTPRTKPQSFTYRGHIWTIEKITFSSSQLTPEGREAARYHLLLHRHDNDPGWGNEARGYLIADELQVPIVHPYLHWDGIDVPSVQLVRALADLVLTHVIMDS